MRLFAYQQLTTACITPWTGTTNNGLESAAALGFIGAVGACGGYLIPRGFGASIAATGSPHLALAVFLGFYVTCIASTWWYYLRKSTLTSIAPSLAEARV